MSQVICDKCLAHYDSIALGSIAHTGCPLCMAIDRIDLLQQQIEAVAQAARVENALRVPEREPEIATGADLDALASQHNVQRVPADGHDEEETDAELRERLTRFLRERQLSDGHAAGSHAAIRKAIADALPPGWTFDSKPPESLQEPLEVTLKAPADLNHRDLPGVLRAVREAIDGARPVGLGVQIEVVRPTSGGPYRDPIVAMAAAEPNDVMRCEVPGCGERARHRTLDDVPLCEEHGPDDLPDEPERCGCEESQWLRGKLDEARAAAEAAAAIPKRPVLPEGTDAALRIASLERIVSLQEARIEEDGRAKLAERDEMSAEIERLREGKIDPKHSRSIVEAVRFLRYLATTKHLGTAEHVTDIRERCVQHAEALEALTK